MQEIQLKYGCNPHQKPSRIYMQSGDLPLTVLNGRPGYINFLDALNAWQLVTELKAFSGIPAAASFKHVSPSGAALGLPMSENLKRACFASDLPAVDESSLAAAYMRARGVDRMSSFGDFIALSDVCDKATALCVKREVSDGIIAPGYDDDALEILKTKKQGNYNVIAIDPAYVPAPVERKEVFGITFEQGRNDVRIDEKVLENIVTQNRDLPDSAKRDLIVSLITLKYTQSNSVCYAFDGQAIGVGAGQQSRIHCTRLAGDKADKWLLRQDARVLDLPFLPEVKRPDRDNAIDVYLSDDYDDVLRDGVWQTLFSSRPAPFTREERREALSKISGIALGSDAFFPFGDNIERAHRSGVSYVAQPGGSIRDDNVIAACDRFGMVMCFDGLRLFHH